MDGTDWAVGTAIVLLLVVVACVGLRGRGGIGGDAFCGTVPREGFGSPAGESPGASSPYIVMGHGVRRPALGRPPMGGGMGENSPCHCPTETGKLRFECNETHPLCWNGHKYSTRHDARAHRARAYCSGPHSYCNTIADSDEECKSCGQRTRGDHPTYSTPCKCPTQAGDARFKCHDPNPYCWNGVKFHRKHEARAMKEWDYCGGAGSYCSTVSRHDKACTTCGGTSQDASLGNVAD